MRRHSVIRLVPVLLALGALAVTVSAHAAPQPDRDPPRRGHKLIMFDDNFTPKQVEERLKEQGVPADVRDQVSKLYDQHHGKALPDAPPADSSGIQAAFSLPFACQLGQDAWVMYFVGYGDGGSTWTYIAGDGFTRSHYLRTFQGDPAGRAAYSEFWTFPNERITKHTFTTSSGGYYYGGSCFG